MNLLCHLVEYAEGKSLSTMKSPKLQRWIDLLAALLRRRFPVTFEELIPDVPAYAAPARTGRPAAAPSSATRTSSAPSAYRSRPCPGPEPEVEATSSGCATSISPISPCARDRPARPRRSTATATSPSLHSPSTPTSCAAVADAAARVRQLGDPLLAEHADSAHAEAGLRPAGGRRRRRPDPAWSRPAPAPPPS